MIGTDYFPDLRNQILFLEDINEPVYKLDRMLNQLQSIGILDMLGGVILGEFVGSEGQYGVESADVFDKYFSKRDYPVVSNFPMGHGKNQVPLKLGYPVNFRVSKSREFSIRYLNED